MKQPSTFSLTFMPSNPPVFQKIDTKTIEDSNTWSLHPFLPTEPSPSLLSSIKRTGILHPPILLPLASGKLQLLCGHFRLLAKHIVNSTETRVTCLTLGQDTSLKEILYLALEDQRLSGNLSPMEKAYFFKLCLNSMDFDEISSEFSSLIGDKVQAHTIKKQCNLLQLEPPLQLSVHNGKTSEKMAHEQLLLPACDRLLLHTVFLDLELGGGKQKRLLSLSKDLAYRGGKSIKELLSAPGYQEVLLHGEMNKPQKISNLLTMLQKELLPESNLAEAVFLEKVRKMDLPPACDITHSQSFEKDDVSITLHFPSIHDMETNITAIKKILK